MSQRLADRFADCRAQKRTAFVGFVTAGYPTLDATVPALLELEKNGCDVIELGVPFSDPMADGSVIEAASVVALKNGVVYSDVLKYAAEARKQGLTVPLLLMGYYNSFLAAGVEERTQDRSHAFARCLVHGCAAALGLVWPVRVGLVGEQPHDVGYLAALGRYPELLVGRHDCSLKYRSSALESVFLAFLALPVEP